MRKSPHRNLLQAAYDCIVGDRLDGEEVAARLRKEMEESDLPIVITVEGGVVQEVLAATPGLTYQIVDYDVEGTPLDQLVALQGVCANVRPAAPATVNPGFIQAVQVAVADQTAKPNRHRR